MNKQVYVLLSGPIIGGVLSFNGVNILQNPIKFLAYFLLLQILVLCCPKE